MDKTDTVLMILGFICVVLLGFLVIMAMMAFRVITESLNTVMTNQMFLSRNSNTRIATARVATGMPDPSQPPRVEETKLIGRGTRSRRRVVGGDPTSAQFQGLEAGLPKVGVEE